MSATIAIAVVALAGCGDSSDNAATFKSGFGRAGNDLQQDAVAIAGAVSGASSQTDARLQSEFSALVGRWQTTLGEVESDLNQLAAAAGAHRAAAARQSAAGLLTDLSP
jgi:hypothetical protein